MKKYLATAILLLTIVINSKAQVELNSSGTGAAYTLSVPGIFSLRNGIQVTFKAHANSVAAPTMNVSGTGAVAILKDGGASSVAAGDIKTGQIVTLAYDGSKWQMLTPLGTPAGSGTVTSVDFAVPAQFSIAGTPLTSSGTITLGWQSNAQNLVLATPNGAAGQPTFRSLVANDIPNLDASKITTGILPLSRGGSGSSLTATNGGIVYSNGTGMAITAAGTSGQVLQSNGTGAPSWTTPSFLPTGTNGQTLRHEAGTWTANSFLYNNGTNIGIGTEYPANIFNILSVRATQADTSGSSGAFIDMHNTANSHNAFSGFRFRGSYNAAPYIDEAYQAGIFFRRSDASNFGRGDLIFATKTTASYGNVHAINDAKMVIKYATGNVGIGTNAPSHKLHVEGGRFRVAIGSAIADLYQSGVNTLLETSGQFQIHANGSGPEFTIDDGNANFYVPLLIQDGSQANNRVLTSNATGYATWTDLSAISSGSTAWTRSTPNIYPTTLTDNVGIGLSNPVSKLQIHSTSGAGNFRLTSAGTGLLATDGFSMSNDGTNEMFMTQNENANWYFSTNGGTIAMTILPSGKIGIGMTSPSAQLEVQNSTASATEKVGTFSLVNATGGGANVGLRGYATNSTSSNYGVQGTAYGNSGTKYGVYASATGTGTNYAGYFTATSGTSNYAIVVPSGGGNVGIGVNPSFPLDVRTSTEDRVTYFYNDKNTTNTTFAVYGGAYGAGSGEKRGGSFEAVNGSGTNIGVRAYATGTGTNWAAYFIGNTYIQGRVGINDATPAYELDVSSTTTTYAGRFKNEGTGGADGLRVEVNTTAVSTGTRYGTYSIVAGGLSTQYGSIGQITSGGTTNYGVWGSASGGTTNNYGVYCSGSGGYTGTWTLISDQRFKENIKPLTGALDKILQLEPKTYNLKAKEYSYMNFPTGTQIGLISQEVEKIIPELVEKASHPISIDEKTGEPTDDLIEFKSMNYIGLTPVLVQAIKEQQLIIEQLKARIEALEKK